MEYLDRCPECDLPLKIIEMPNNYAILTMKNNSIGSHCPNCKSKLAVGQDGLYVVKRSDESDLEQDED